MTASGRSMDDLPLAAYSRRAKSETADDDLDPPTDDVLEARTTGAPAAFAGSTFEPAASERLPADDEVDAAPAGLAAFDRARAFASRNPRLVAGGAFVAIIVVGLTLLSGGGPSPSAAGAVASPSAPPIVPVAADPGSATLVLTGSIDGTYAFTGNALQPVAGTAVAATWADTLQNVLTLDGPVDRGTRTTDAGLVLTWGLVIDGKLVTFTSKDGECTIGMAANPKTVSGSFACRKIKSDDGKLTVGASGTYRT